VVLERANIGGIIYGHPLVTPSTFYLLKIVVKSILQNFDELNFGTRQSIMLSTSISHSRVSYTIF